MADFRLLLFGNAWLQVNMVACLDLQVLFLTQLRLDLEFAARDAAGLSTETRYDFQFEPDGECLVLQSFLLEELLPQSSASFK